MCAATNEQIEVVDCDSHIMEPANLWTDYLEHEFKSRAIRVEENDGVEKLIIGEKVVLQGILAGLGGANIPRAKLFTSGYKYADGCPEASYLPQQRIVLLDSWNVQKGVLFPTICILPFPTDDQKLASAYCRAYNTWLIDFCKDIGDRVIPIAVLNWHDIDTAAAEFDRCIAAGFKGVFVPPETVGDKRPGHPDFDPIWSRCQEADIPGCFHVIVRFEGAAVPFRSWHTQSGSIGPTFTFGMGPVGQLVPAIASVVVDGLFDRFERLKVVSVEAGAGYAPYLMDRLNEKHHFFEFASPLKLKPGEYIQRNCYFVAEPEERTIDNVLELVGEDRVLWGSDYPHIDSRLDARELIDASLANLSLERRQAVLGNNARAVFGC